MAVRRYAAGWQGRLRLIFGAVGITFVLATGCLHAADVKPAMLLLDGAVVGTDVVVVGERGTILRSSDHARTWQAAAQPLRAALTAVCFAPGATTQSGWALGHDALILATSDGGLTWTKQYQGESAQDSFLDVLALDAQQVIAVGAYGLFLESTDGGKTWTRRKVIEDDRHLNRLTRGPTGTLYLAGERGTLLRSSDNGAKWTTIAAPYDGSFYGVLPLDRRTVIAYGLRGHVFRSNDDGTTWKLIRTPQPVLLATAVKLKSNLIVLAGGAGTLLVSQDYGESFAPAESPAKGIAELVELADGNLLALGEAGATVIDVGRVILNVGPKGKHSP